MFKKNDNVAYFSQMSGVRMKTDLSGPIIFRHNSMENGLNSTTGLNEIIKLVEINFHFAIELTPASSYDNCF